MSLTHASTAFHLGKITETLPKCEHGKRFMDCISAKNNQYCFSYQVDNDPATYTVTVPSIVVITGMSEVGKRGIPVIGSRFSFNENGYLIDVKSLTETACCS